jgi:hypothetical protein
VFCHYLPPFSYYLHLKLEKKFSIRGIADVTSSQPLQYGFNIQYYCKISYFFNQGADIKFISGLVNKKPRFRRVNRLKKLKIAKLTLFCGSKMKETPDVVAIEPKSS